MLSVKYKKHSVQQNVSIIKHIIGLNDWYRNKAKCIVADELQCEVHESTENINNIFIRKYEHPSFN